MNNLIYIIVGMIIIFICLIIVAIIAEKKAFNNGICKCCGKPLHHFDIDSQGGRLYTCDDFCNLVSVSYKIVDKSYKDI